MLLIVGSMTNAQTIKRQKQKTEQTQKSSSNTPKNSSPKTSQSKKNTSKKSSKTATKSTKVDNQKSDSSSESNQKISDASNNSSSNQSAIDEQKETNTAAFGWGENIKDSEENVVENTQNSGEQIYRSVDYMPHFPGGESALLDYLKKNIRYPVGAALRGGEGRVVVQFVVTATGEVGDIKVVRSIDEELDSEAVRVCRLLPRFEPGRLKNGDPVNVWYTLPIRFTLPKHERSRDD